jgi:hypothetical protein
METATTIDLLLDAIRGRHGSTPWSDDATLDAVVPGWRFSVTGAAKIDEQFRAWFRDPADLEELRRFPTSSGEVIELTVAWAEDGVPFAARQIHVLDIDDDGRITRDNMWCGGRWSADLLAKMEAAGHAH